MTDNRVLAPLHAFSLAMLAYFLFTVADATGKWLQSGYGVAQILVTINVVGLAIMIAIALIRRGPRDAFKSDKWRIHAIRSVIMAVSTVLVLYALARLPLSEFYGIIFLNPIWVAIISRVFLKQDIPPSRWIAIFVGFLGVLVIAGAEFANFNLAVIATLVSSIMGAVAALMARQIGGHEPPTNFSIATHVGMIAINLPFMLGNYVTPALPDLALMGFYGATLAFAMMSIALVFARSHVVSQVAPLQYTQMIWGVLIGWLVFGHAPTMNVLAGSLLVTGAGIYILRSLRRGRIMNH